MVYTVGPRRLEITHLKLILNGYQANPELLPEFALVGSWQAPEWTCDMVIGSCYRDAVFKEINY